MDNYSDLLPKLFRTLDEAIDEEGWNESDEFWAGYLSSSLADYAKGFSTRERLLAKMEKAFAKLGSVTKLVSLVESDREFEPPPDWAEIKTLLQSRLA